MKYYLLTDSNTQWFNFLAAGNIVSGLDDLVLKTDFARSIMERDSAIIPVKIQMFSSVYGWSISQREYDRLKEIESLLPALKRFDKLAVSG